MATENETQDKLETIRDRIRESAAFEIKGSLKESLDENSIDYHEDIKLIHQLATNFNESFLGILVDSGDSNNFDVLCGGAYSNFDDKFEDSKGKALSPFWQIDLHRLGKMLGFNSNERFLEIWVNSNNWGQGVEVFYNLKNYDGETKPENFKFFDSKGFSFTKRDEEAEYFIALKIGHGCLTESLIEMFECEGVVLHSTVKLCDEIDEATNGLADSLLIEHQFVGSTETDCCNAAIIDSIKTKKVWKPLLKLNGPNDNLLFGNIDQYSVFYTTDKDLTINDIKVYCHRWNH
jgi:hypothetical protein